MKVGKQIKEFLERNQIHDAIARTVKFLLALIFCLHLASCFWMIFGKLEENTVDSWLFAQDLVEESSLTQYEASFYFQVQILMKIGYGDITPVNTSEQMFTFIWMTFGIGFYTFMVSNLSSIFMTISQRKSALGGKEHRLRDFAKDIKMPQDLWAKILWVIQKNHNQHTYSWLDKTSFLKQLPPRLYTEVYNHLLKDIIDKCVFFQDRPNEFIW